jgi:BMFP domain-containing protein YqiC
MAARARTENERLEARLDALEAAQAKPKSATGKPAAKKS